jgi:hypothetical protein
VTPYFESDTENCNVQLLLVTLRALAYAIALKTPSSFILKSYSASKAALFKTVSDYNAEKEYKRCSHYKAWIEHFLW